MQRCEEGCLSIGLSLLQVLNTERIYVQKTLRQTQQVLGIDVCVRSCRIRMESPVDREAPAPSCSCTIHLLALPPDRAMSRRPYLVWPIDQNSACSSTLSCHARPIGVGPVACGVHVQGSCLRRRRSWWRRGRRPWSPVGSESNMPLHARW